MALVTWLIDGGTRDSVILDLSSEGLPQHGALTVGAPGLRMMQAGEACIANLLEPLFNSEQSSLFPLARVAGIKVNLRLVPGPAMVTGLLHKARP